MAEPEQATQPQSSDDMREFMLVIRQALLLIVGWIERRYNLIPKHLRQR